MLGRAVSDVIDFPDFDATAAAELTHMMLAQKRLALPEGLGADAFVPWTSRLVAAPRWANGRDVETLVRRVAVECATRRTSVVSTEIMDAALATVLKMKALSSSSSSSSSADADTLSTPLPSSPEPSPFVTADPVAMAPPSIDIKKAMEVAFDVSEPDEDGADETEPADLGARAERLQPRTRAAKAHSPRTRAALTGPAFGLALCSDWPSVLGLCSAVL